MSAVLPVTDVGLVTLQEVLTHVRATAETDSALLSSLIREASSFVSGRCDRRIFQTPLDPDSGLPALYTEYLDGNGRSVIWTDHWPILIDGGAVGAGIWLDSFGEFPDSLKLTQRIVGSSNATTNYMQFWLAANGGERGQGAIHATGGVWPCGQGNIKVSYQGGYLSDLIPEPVKAAALLVIGNLFELKRNSLVAYNSAPIAGGSGSLSVDKEISDRVDAWIAPFRRHVL